MLKYSTNIYYYSEGKVWVGNITQGNHMIHYTTKKTHWDITRWMKQMLWVLANA